MPHFSHGVIVDKKMQIFNDSTYTFNYDKLTGILILTRDGRSYTELDNKLLTAFAVQDQDTSFIFMKVPIIDTENFYSLVALGNQYGVYRSVKTKLVRSDYFTSGLIERGNNYDEYIDDLKYFLVDYINRRAYMFTLDRKSIRRAIPFARSFLSKYLLQHRRDALNEEFLVNLMEYMNNLPQSGNMMAFQKKSGNSAN